MSGRRLIPRLAAAFALLFFLSACGGEGVVRQGYSVESAIEAGVLMAEGVDSNDRALEIVQATRRDLTISTALRPRFVFPIEQQLFFPHRHDGELLMGHVTVLVESGQSVNEGDALARLTFDAEARHEIDYLAARQSLEQFEEDFIRERNRRNAEIAEARREQGLMEGAAAQQASLVIRQSELALERFISSSAVTRSALAEAVEFFAQTLDGAVLRAPIDGMVHSVATCGIFVSSHNHIMSIVDYNVFFYEITVRASQHATDFYNVIGRGDILTLRGSLNLGDSESDDENGEPIEIDVRVVTDSWVSGQRGVFTYLLAPVDKEGLFEYLGIIAAGYNPVYILRSIPVTVQLAVTAALDSVTLPIRAVHAEAGRQFIYIYNEGALGKRYVHATNRIGGYAQIVTGIESGTQVVILP
ncbi:MAG: hypothetical protein FWB97_01855 [Oscillospiraceae bacterium]|nr:hypothetical protein [Oscillospiraceae bacterium]